MGEYTTSNVDCGLYEALTLLSLLSEKEGEAAGWVSTKPVVLAVVHLRYSLYSSGCDIREERTLLKT